MYIHNKDLRLCCAVVMWAAPHRSVLLFSVCVYIETSSSSNGRVCRRHIGSDGEMRVHWRRKSAQADKEEELAAR